MSFPVRSKRQSRTDSNSQTGQPTAILRTTNLLQSEAIGHTSLNAKICWGMLAVLGDDRRSV